MVMQIPYLIPLFFVMFLAYIACQVVNSLFSVHDKKYFELKRL